MVFSASQLFSYAILGITDFPALKRRFACKTVDGNLSFYRNFSNRFHNHLRSLNDVKGITLNEVIYLHFHDSRGRCFAKTVQHEKSRQIYVSEYMQQFRKWVSEQKRHE